MSKSFRHFKSLMRKNAINYKRTCCGSITELLCPVFVMAILALIRLADEPEYFDSESQLQEAINFYPTSIKMNGEYIFAPDMSTTHMDFLEFANITSSADSPLAFFPIQCYVIEFESEDEDEEDTSDEEEENDNGFEPRNATMIGYVEHENQEELDVIKQLQQLFDFQQSMQPDLFHDFTFMRFTTHEEMQEYIAHKRYNRDPDRPGMCFGFEIIKNSEKNFEVSLMFNDQDEFDPYESSIPNQNNPPWSQVLVNSNTGAYQDYTKGGYLFLQNLIANTILRNSVDSGAVIEMVTVPVTTQPYVDDPLILQLLQDNLPFFVLLMYIPPLFRNSYRIVNEKETRIRESMKIMGLTDVSYWLSWMAYHAIVCLMVSVMATLTVYINVFKNSSPVLIFMFFFFYGFSLFGYIVVLTPFFQKARYAGLFISIFYFATQFVDVLVQDKTVSEGSKLIASLLQPVALYRSGGVVAQLEVSGIGLTFDNVGQLYKNYRVSSFFRMMVFDFIWQVALGLYFDNVVPQQHGQTKPFYFICQMLAPSYWDCIPCLRKRYASEDDLMKKKAKKHIDGEELQDLDGHEHIETKYIDPMNFDPPETKLLELQEQNKYLRVQDLQKTYSNGFKAVQGVSVRMYEGQIFALLGHNGAGKTTTLSMISGLHAATGGKAEVFGKSIFDDLDSVRQFMGVCPQHDVLFDLLTPEEHLSLFYDFKGANPDKKVKAEEIKKILQDIGLYYAKDKCAGTMSGGMKRKLSVGIAMCGNSKFVLLDEPTAGMDLSARRGLWEMLRAYRFGRIIILTTHYMDEADILGDRIGIMTAGQLVCLGSSLFLKQRYGVGYNLTLVKKTKEENLAALEYINRELGTVEKLSEVSSEITIQVPTDLSNKFKDFFMKFDEKLEELEIESYGISVTTLEEVFLSVGEGGSGKKKKTDMNELLMNEDKAEDMDLVEYSIAEQDYSSCCGNVAALFFKRIKLYQANKSAIYSEVCFPTLLVIIGLAMSKVSFFFNSPARLLTPDLFPVEQRLLMNSEPIISNLENDYSNQLLFQNLPNSELAFDVDYVNYKRLTYGMTEDELSRYNYMSDFNVRTFDDRLDLPLFPYRYGHYLVYQADTESNHYRVVNFVNTTSQDATAAFPQFMYESIMRTAANTTDFEFKLSTKAYPVIQKYKEREVGASTIFLVFVMAIGFSIMPTSIISFIIIEKEKNLKQIQLVSGMYLSAYWFVNIVFDIFKTMIPISIMIAFFYIFDTGYDNIWIILLAFPISIIPFTYAFSFLFSDDGSAQFTTVFFNFFQLDLMVISVFVLRFIESTAQLGDGLNNLFRLFPAYPLTNAILFEGLGENLASARDIYEDAPEIDEDPWAPDNLTADLTSLIRSGILFTIIVILVEFNPCKRFCANITFCPCKIPRKKDLGNKRDKDVVNEEERVASYRRNKQNRDKTNKDMLVKVDDFRKVYTKLCGNPFLAVEKVSFGLEAGECFALLGVNGAGKTTTFKSLTNEIVPTSGTVSVGGFNVNSQFSKARKLIGYCPQYDCIFDIMTVQDHLIYYAQLKGIKRSLRARMVEKTIQDLNLDPHRHKQAGTLSGGNKRKLSVGIAIIGNPSVVLLDEPSAGMDPEARRFMWTVVAKISQHRKKCGVILTTHSMEEAEALSTKMGIMVRGGIFKCFGSALHIKNKYGTGYEIEVKIGRLTEETTEIIKKRFNFGDQEKIQMTDLVTRLKECKFPGLLIDELCEGGIGHDLYKEAHESQGNISIQNVCEWINAQEHGQQIVSELIDQFTKVDLLEQYADYFKLRVLRQNKTIGFVFGLIETKKEEFGIAEYSVSQTTLEQIFQQFAQITYGNNERKIFQRSKETQEIILTREELTEAQTAEEVEQGLIGENEQKLENKQQVENVEDDQQAERDLL